MDKESLSHRVADIHRLALRMPDLGRAEAFYRDIWQMREAERDGLYSAFRTAASDHNDFLISEGPQQIDHIAFAVASAQDLGLLAERLRRAGFTPERLRDADLLRGDGEAIAVPDTDGRRIWLVVPEKDPAFVAASPGPLAPQRIGHVVLWTPAEHLDRAERFYGLLGFQVSDRTHLGMSFLRCNADHHTLALAKSKHGKTGLQHIAFDVVSLDNVMRNYGRLREKGVACAWGVGRHGPGNNIFSYYTDPAGNYIEYYSDMEKFGGDELIGEPRFWGPEHRGDIWGVSGMAPLSFRE